MGCDTCGNKCAKLIGRLDCDDIASDDEECKGVSDSLYQKMLDDRMEVIYDDRTIRPGAMFSDADLLGVPVE